MKHLKALLSIPFHKRGREERAIFSKEREKRILRKKGNELS